MAIGRASRESTSLGSECATGLSFGGGRGQPVFIIIDKTKNRVRKEGGGASSLLHYTKSLQTRIIIN